jgi:hypothetical protein
VSALLVGSYPWVRVVSPGPVGEVGGLRPATRRTRLPILVGSVTEQPSFPVPATQIIPKHVEDRELASTTFTSDPWEDHDFCCDSSTLRQFIQPLDEVSFFRSTRLAIDNLTHPRSRHYLLPNQSARHHILSDVFNHFGSVAERCFQSRIHDGVIIYESAFGVVDFRSEEEAHAAFLSLQGRRIQGEKAHWRLEFLDPGDMTFGDRLPIISSEPPWELIRQLDAVTYEPERINSSLRPPFPSRLPRCGPSKSYRRKKGPGRAVPEANKTRRGQRRSGGGPQYLL